MLFVVTLDPHLTFNDHIVNTVSSCMSCLGQINRVKHAFDRRTLITVLNAVVFSKLCYYRYSNVWVNSSNCNIDKLQSIQNFACRIVSAWFMEIRSRHAHTKRIRMAASTHASFIIEVPLKPSSAR